MSDTAAFLRAVIAAPDDDLPRLIYADWLDERDDPRGEFIRVQCELATYGKYECKRSDTLHGLPIVGVKQCQCKWHALRRRERSLLERHWTQWAVPIPSGGRDYTYCDDLYPHKPTPGNSISFRRGFVEVIVCTLADWLQHGPAIVRACPVREVRLSDRRPAESEHRRDGITLSAWTWFDEQIADIVRPGNWLPWPIYSLLAESGRRDGYRGRHYTHSESALADLSAALIAWAKAEADRRDAEPKRRWSLARTRPMPPLVIDSV